MKSLNEQTHLIQFGDNDLSSFVNEIKISDNITYEQRDGYLYCNNAILGHTGESKYYDHELGGYSNKSVSIFKHKEDLLNEESIKTLIGKPVTRLGHPRDINGKIKFLNSKNYKDYEIGTVLNAWADGEFLRGNIIIKDSDAIIDILDGKYKALSLGYNAKLEEDGQGNLKQTRFYHNHVSFVPKGRMAYAQIVDEDTVKEEDKTMNLWEKVKSYFKSEDSNKEKGEITFNDNDQVVEFVDEKRVTKRIRVVEETFTYDDETGETSEEVKTHEKSSTTRDKDEYALGDESTVEETQEQEAQQEETKEEDSKLDTQNEETQEKENIKEKEFGDESMNEEQLKALREQIKKEVIDGLKAEKGADAFGDINPITTAEEKPKFQLDFQKEEQIKIQFYRKATNPAEHYGDFNKMNEFRKQAFN